MIWASRNTKQNYDVNINIANLLSQVDYEIIFCRPTACS